MVTKFQLNQDVKDLLTHGSDFARHIANGDFDAAQADMDARDEIVKRDRQAWELAKAQHNAQASAERNAA